MSSKKLEEIKNQLLSKKRFRIVFLGDSIVSTEAVHPNWRGIVEYVLKGKIGEMLSDWKLADWEIKCINSGLNGATTKDLLERLKIEVFDHKPKMVICMIGSNDPYFNISPSQHKKNVKELIEKISSKIPYLVFCTSTPDNNKETREKYAKYVDQVKSLSSHPKVQFINMFEIYQQFNLDKFFTFISEYGNEVVGIKPGEVDFQHPNSLGNAYIAKVVLKEVFGIDFDPELYMKTLLAGAKNPKY